MRRHRLVTHLNHIISAQVPGTSNLDGEESSGKTVSVPEILWEACGYGKATRRAASYPRGVSALDPGYTVFMTKGTHVVSTAMADRILEAIREGQTDVTVELDVLEHNGHTVEMILVTAHVVSLMKHRDERGDIEFANVRQLRPLS